MNKLNIYTLCVWLCFAWQIGAAQTKFWGVGAATGQADAEFANPFVQSTTPSNYSPTEWTALSVYDTDSISPGNAFWTRTLLGRSQGAYWGGTNPMPSPSQPNGMAIFDSDFMDNGGTQGAFGMGTSPSPHKGELISPRIDLTAAADTGIMVRFFCLYRSYQISDLSLSISIDDGTTWSSANDIMALHPAIVQGFARIIFPNITTGAGNLSQCRIKFSFEGDYYFALIDDISIETAPEYDIALSTLYSNPYYNEGDFVKIGGNRYNPMAALNTSDLREWFYGAKVLNRGSNDILPIAHPRLRMKIDFENPTSGQIIHNVYNDTIISNDTIKANSLDGVNVIEYMRNINFIMTYGPGTYIVNYWAEQDSIDGHGMNDTIRYYFTINGNYSLWFGNAYNTYLSKARIASADGKVYGSRTFIPRDDSFSAFEYGSLFYLPIGNSNSYSFLDGIDSIVFRYRVLSGFSGSSTQTLLVKVSQFIDGYNGGIADGLISSEELITRMVAPGTLTGLGTVGAKSTKVVFGFLDSLNGSYTNIYNSGFYFISVLTQPSLFGGPATFRMNEVPWVTADEVNYVMNASMTSSTYPIVPSAFRIVDSLGVETWNNWSSGFSDYNHVPSIGVYLGTQVPIKITNIENNPSSNFTLYPNPTNHLLTIEPKFQEPTDIQYIITDITGRVFYLNYAKNGDNQTHIVDVKDLPAGVYLVNLKTDEGVSTEKFVKN